MFKHSNPAVAPVKPEPVSIPEKIGQPAPMMTAPGKDSSPAALRDLLEKNLKWSQIIYEQNRKINNKLFWSAVASWLRTLVIVIPLVLGILLLPPLIQKLKSQYGSLFVPRSGQSGSSTTPATMEEVLKVLPLNELQREQLKNILK